MTTADPVAVGAEQLKLFIPAFTAGHAGQLVVELRAINVPRQSGTMATVSGFFDLAADDSRAAFWASIQALVGAEPERQPAGVYVTLNPLAPALLGRANGRVKVAGKGVAAGDKDVIARRWLPIDIDPKRPPNTSATEAEKAAARRVADAVRADLRARGWPDPLFLDSGNGFHLWYLIDLPAEDDGRVRDALKALAGKHHVAGAGVDTAVFNPSRIMKLPGTWARKGADTPERPHRLARVLDVPGVMNVVPTKLIVALAAEARPPSRVPPRNSPTAGNAWAGAEPTGASDPGADRKAVAAAVEACRAYLTTLPPSVEGDGGSNRIFQAARVIWNDFGLNRADGYPLLQEFNRRSDPAWPEDGPQGLRRKWDEAVSKGSDSRDRGWRCRPGVTLTAEPDGKRHKVTATADGVVVHVDVLNLSSATARGKFVAAVCDKAPDADRDRLDAELLRIAADANERPTPDAADAPDPLAGTPQDVIDEAKALLADPKLVERVCDDIAAVGVAGERELAMTLYLVGVSRLLPTPLAAIVRGSSSSGKSYTIERVASLFPPEGVITATKMTPQALFHMPPGSLVHKWVVAGERSRLENDDTAEATRALREMLSSRKLSKLMPVKEGHELKTQLIEQDGPIAFVESTTLTAVFEEDANRCVMLQTDESEAQTRRILEALAGRHSGAGGNAALVVRVHHALHRLLPRGAEVRVPWAGRVATAFECRRVEVRRAFPQLLALVQASALLHHEQRGRGDDGAILADARDYHLARRLLAKPFAQSLGGGLSAAALNFLASLPKNEDFTSRSVAKTLKASKSAAAGWLSELYDAGAVQMIEEARGNRPAKWKTTGTPPAPGENLLPSVEKIFPECAGRVDAEPFSSDSR